MNIATIVIIVFIIMLFWYWKSGEITCKVCGKRMSDKNIQKHYGIYGCLADHALCEKCRQKWE